MTTSGVSCVPKFGLLFFWDTLTHSATSHPPNAIKEIKKRRTKMRASACPRFMGVMSQARGLSAARVGSSGSAGCALEMMTGVFTHFQHPRQNSPLFLGFETMKIITFCRQPTSHQSVRDSEINGSILNNSINMGVWESWRPVYRYSLCALLVK